MPERDAPTLTRPLRLGQLNCHHSRAATAEAESLLGGFGLDCLCLQEPYAYGGRMGGFSGCRVFYGPGENPKSAVVSTLGAGEIVGLAHLSCEWFTVVHVSRGPFGVVLVSGYFQPSISVDFFLGKLGRILDSLRERMVLLALDANAKSVTWGSNRTDPRGASLLQFLEARNLFVVNDPAQPPTYSSELGESHIDVTLVTGALVQYTQSWNVWPEASLSDHRLITYEVSRGRVQSENEEMFILRDSDVERLRWSCQRLLGGTGISYG
jgi:hypothetical protein